MRKQFAPMYIACAEPRCVEGQAPSAPFRVRPRIQVSRRGQALGSGVMFAILYCGNNCVNNLL